MIANLFPGLCGDRSQALVERGRQTLVELELECIYQYLPDNGLTKIAVRLLRQNRVEIGALLAQVSELVFVAAATFDLAGVAQEQPCLTDQVERNIGEPQILFERGSVAHPFTQTLPQHQAQVTEPQHIAKQRLRAGLRRSRAHNVFTSSGMS